MPRFERAEGRGDARFFEIEQRENVVLFADGGLGRPTRQRERQCQDQEEAYVLFAQEIRRKRRAGYVAAGSVREIDGAAPPRPPGSALLIDIYLAAQDERFLEELLHFEGSPKLAALAEKWFEDTRPFARRMLLAYIDDGCDRPGHKPLVKRLFKRAEAAEDDELLVHFMVAFDRWLRRHLAVVGWDWDPEASESRKRYGFTQDPQLDERLYGERKLPRFTKATRRYLARRAFRYFRRIGYRDGERYRRAMVIALELYREEHVSSAARLLGSWGLMHILYGRSPVLSRLPDGVRLARGRALAELTPAPMFAEVWEGAFSELLGLVVRARSRTVRAWALALLRQSSADALAALPLDRVKELILAEHEEPQLLGVELLLKLGGLESASLSDWLELLGTKNLDVLSAVCDRAQGYVSAKRLTLAQCVDIAGSPAAPLAALGLAWCKEKKIASEAELVQLLRLGRAPVAGVRAEGALHCAKLLRELPFVRPEHVRELLDAPFADARSAGLACLNERFAADLKLWLALCESPYPDVRAVVVARAESFRAEVGPEALSPVFATVMLSLHGAAAEKRRVARELVLRVGKKPEEAAALMPLLAALFRSIHPAELRLGLAALAAIAVRVSGVRSVIEARFPELRIGSQVSE
jgi:hypothetical protein